MFLKQMKKRDNRLSNLFKNKKEKLNKKLKEKDSYEKKQNKKACNISNK